MMSKQISTRAFELRGERVPFVHATVVRAQVPTSAHAGDDAIVLSDGSIEGFVGGQCAETSVRAAALDVLRAGEARLLRVLPDGDAPFPDTPGAQVVVNPCLSGGALEIFLDPVIPPPVIEVAGDTPVARAVLQLAEFLGYATGRSVSGVVSPSSTAVVVASHGLHEHDAIRAALDAGIGYIALVASRRRGSAVLDELGLSAAERERVSTPAGLAIGARTAPEVALSIMAEVVTALHAGDEVRSGSRPEPGEPVVRAATAIDPVCGMTVVTGPDALQSEVDGETFWFCGPHCLHTFEQQRGR